MTYLVLTASSPAVARLLRSQSRTAQSLGELQHEEDGHHDGGHDEADEGPVGEHSRC